MAAKKKIMHMTHGHHKFWVTVLIIGSMMLGLYFGAFSYGFEYVGHNVEIVTVTLAFVATMLLLINTSLLLKVLDELR
ncbi:MAG: hypothetical protein ABH879_01730 [archaeon]